MSRPCNCIDETEPKSKEVLTLKGKILERRGLDSRYCWERRGDFGRLAGTISSEESSGKMRAYLQGMEVNTAERRGRGCLLELAAHRFVGIAKRVVERGHTGVQYVPR